LQKCARSPPKRARKKANDGPFLKEVKKDLVEN
jgi:hypothetical protein